ncbi:cyclodeaminase/cyclohydrolase family protein [Dendrosporobacter sp. 1207_IL3150]|uniref:cyclodeaminase/cyclohydrolase family protein n=1 Tax=Dendrosporobacter sp. 1207_IL3150 TaxID=3084054 RepID=UPI002FD99891
MLVSLPMQDFFEQMSKQPPPGGGSAAAAAGLMGVSLVQMAVAISEKHLTGCKSGVSEEFTVELAAIHQSLLKLIDQDAKVLAEVLPIISAPCNSEVNDLETYNNAVRLAIEVPLEIARCSQRVLEIGKTLLEHCVEHVIGDLTFGLLSCHNAVSGALLMVALNLPLLHDQEIISDIKRQVSSLKNHSENLITEIKAVVYIKDTYTVLNN